MQGMMSRCIVDKFRLNAARQWVGTAQFSTTLEQWLSEDFAEVKQVCFCLLTKRRHTSLGIFYVLYCHVMQVPASGRSVFAKRDINHGDTVLEEQPLVCTPGAYEAEQVCCHAGHPAQLSCVLFLDIDKLSRSVRLATTVYAP